MTVGEMLDKILSSEGGFTNNPADHGGPTNYGITQRTLSSFLGRSATVDEVRSLSRETAKEILTRNYFTGPRLDTLPEAVQPFMFDWAVNHGPKGAIRTLQDVLNLAGFGPIEVDGILGPQTREKAIEAWGQMGSLFINALVDQRAIEYEQIINNDPSQERFRAGWLARDEQFRVR